VSADGVITTVAGTGPFGDAGDGGPATQAGISSPSALAFDRDNDLFILESGGAVRKIDTHGVITTLTGNTFLQQGFGGDGKPIAQAIFNGPRDLRVDASGNLFIADTGNDRVREVDNHGLVSTFAGNGEKGFSGDHGPARKARLNTPSALAVDRQGNVFILDTLNFRVREVTAR
jgi:sugar lactone lactonase YvrE